MSPTAGIGSLELEVRAPWPYRLPRRTSPDGTMRARGNSVCRLLHVDGLPVIVRAAQRRDGRVVFHANSAGRVDGDVAERLEIAVGRMRFALGIDEDLRDFYERFRRDPLIGPAIRRRPWLRPSRRPWPWEALAWAVTKQLIESGRAAAIQRRILRRFGARGPEGLRDLPPAEVIAARAPAELAALDLSMGRSIALIRVAREVAAGRVDPSDPADDRRLLAIREIGPWTMQCLGLLGRGEADSLPAGDLAYVKLVGRLRGGGRRATVPEVEEFFAPYAPYRGLAGTFALAHHHKSIATGPPLRLAA